MFVRPSTVEANVQFPEFGKSCTECTCKCVDEIPGVPFEVGLGLAAVPAQVVVIDKGQTVHGVGGGGGSSGWQSHRFCGQGQNNHTAGTVDPRRAPSAAAKRGAPTPSDSSRSSRRSCSTFSPPRGPRRPLGRDLPQPARSRQNAGGSDLAGAARVPRRGRAARRRRLQLDRAAALRKEAQGPITADRLTCRITSGGCMPGVKQEGLQLAHCGSCLRPRRRVVRVLRVTAAGSLSLLPAFRPIVLHPVRDRLLCLG